MTEVSAIVRLNIAGLSDDDLTLLRGSVARAVRQDPGADEHNLLGALDAEIDLRKREP